MGALTAFASAAAAVFAFAVIAGQGRALEEDREAVALAHMVGYAASMDPLGADGRPVADLTSPGLEDESILRLMPELIAEVATGGMRQVVRRDAVIYVALPLIDRSERVRGVIGTAMPAEAMQQGDNDVAAFAGVAAAIAVVLGLLAATILTRQVAWPVRHLAELAGRLEDAGFDTSKVTDLIGRRDEIGRLARVMLRLVQAIDHLGREMDDAGDRRREGRVSD